MTFDDDARIDSSKVRRRGRGRGVAIGAGGGGIVVIGLFLLSQVLGVDLTGLAPVLDGGGSGSGTSQESEELTGCSTGADANASVDCRMAGAATSLSAFWTVEAGSVGASSYVDPDFFLFDQSTDTGCGQATSAVGPFYCPPDTAIYIDTAFYDDLRSKYGSTGGPLAEMYVVAHEWGHHIQNLTGVLERAQDGQTGPTSNGVRVELQADCYAGAWAAGASRDDGTYGEALLEPITDAQVADALSAAAAVGDDRIQGTTANSETWTHGSSESRQKWFTTGYNDGPTACDTFAVATP
ncbi:neutral zinc metallopeptidase [Amnibacterium flavum]|uniref:Neutral zinc metallopeptidase n=1 Tax=Amnibacterium flavum TaxID=2173173 RepID=A0A2V1HY05_9MICO|nr:neutral zinc metallopeptidase [Amnibacterium flavum]PVZ95274.1 neutral zinc metallopeptidase [Amnibacterium flavum]